MSISDLAEKHKAAGSGCAVCRVLAEIPPSEAEGLRSLLRGKKRYSEISALIAADPDTPISLTGDLLGKHARGACSANEKLRGA